MLSRLWLKLPATNIRAKRGANVFVDNREVEPIGVEMAAAPALGIAMLRIVRISNNDQKAFVTVGASNVLGRTCLRSVYADRNFGRRLDCHASLDLDEMTPVISEVITVKKGRTFCAEVTEKDLFFPKCLLGTFASISIDIIGFAVAQPTDTEFVQMIVPPIEGCLDNEMELPEVPTRRHHNRSPDCRLDLIESDTKLNGVDRMARHDRTFPLQLS